MFSELTNLVPQQSTQAFRRNYFLRLATVGILLVSISALIHGLLLMPAYLYAQDEVKSESSELDHLTNSLATAEEQQAQTQLSSLQSEATYLSKLSSTPTASAAIRAILAVPAQGIKLNGFTFSPSNGSTPGSMQISGVADTREDLRSYDAALSALPFVTSADLPISDYANESNIIFTVTLSGSLNPTTP